MNEFLIRQMHAGDIDRVEEIEQLSFSMPWSRSAFEAEMHDNDVACYLVVETAASVIAYAGMWLIVDEAHITNVAVAPEHRGLGIGEALLKAMIDKAKEKGAGAMTLEVRPSNTAARNLYAKMGFVLKGIRRHYYTDNKEDAQIMWRDPL